MVEVGCEMGVWEAVIGCLVARSGRVDEEEEDAWEEEGGFDAFEGWGEDVVEAASELYVQSPFQFPFPFPLFPFLSARVFISVLTRSS